jgi:lipopolysaccharide/colanic/teichoic acid biosynthesis glycosyltransferase
LPRFRDPKPLKMDTLDASIDPPVGLVDSLHVCRAPVSEAAAEAPSPKTATDTASPAIPLWKRVFDVTCILLSVPFWLPIALVIMMWIKIVSPGPIFFRQERIGFRGGRFMILKFRTMKTNVETRSHEQHLEHLINANTPMTSSITLVSLFF